MHQNHTFPGGIWKPHTEEIAVLAAYLPENTLQNLWDRIFVKDLKFNHFHYLFMILYHEVFVLKAVLQH